ncbi:MAG: glycosyltransferase [Sphingomonadaceae bacterium]|nr:glycosyltransferase [Sphingomonadaceae bacterium]
MAVTNPHFLGCAPQGAESLLKPAVVTAFEHLIAHELPASRYAPENRLLMVGNSLGGGGMERVMSETYRHFAAADAFDHVDLALIDWADQGPRAFYRELAGVSRDDVLRLREGGEARHPCALLPNSWRALVQRLHDHIAETRPRAIHAWNDLTGLFAAFAGLLAGCPRIIAHFHHLPVVPQSGRTRDIASYPDCYRLLRARPELRFLFCSQAAARGYADWWSIARDARLEVLYNGLTPLEADPERGKQVRVRHGIPPEAPVIGSVFRFDPVKQPLLWADAAAALAARAPDPHFLLVGDGPLRAETEARFAQAGLADRAHFAGQTPDVADHLAAMHLFWLTSRTEGLPTAIIEAQMAGVPVLAFDVGGVSETMADGVTGRLIAADDMPGLIEATVSSLAAPRWRSDASREATAFARERFSRDRFFDALDRVYRRAD